MLRNILLISTLFVAAYASGQLTILSSAKNVQFANNNEELNGNIVGDVISASLGYSTEESSDWSALNIQSPFETADAAVVVIVDGVSALAYDADATSYGTVGSGSQESIESLANKLQERNVVTVEIDIRQGIDKQASYKKYLGPESVPEKVVTALKPKSYVEDKQFLEQIRTIDSFAANLATAEEKPQLVVFHVSLSKLIVAHSENSPAFVEATKILRNACKRLSDAVSTVYAHEAVVAVVANKEESVFRKKRAISANGDVIPENINLAKTYNANYPVIFNIILWFGVVLTFSLLSIAYTIAYMDPGRDSIIYRMTSTRMKKDN